jgi:asparagine synthase (glutamine-hydrolysing)
MSGLLAITGFVSPARLDAARERLGILGGGGCDERIWSDQGTMLGVTRKQWELGADFSGPVLLLEDPDLVVAADAALYDRARLTQELASAQVTPGGSTPAHLIEAAYRAWGPALVQHLVGDYAFVIWDRRVRRLLAARDPLGMRPLYYALLEDRIALASSSRALAELAGRTTNLNLACLGAQAAGMVWASGTDTAFEGVDPVPAGHLLVWERGRTRLDRFWHPPAAPDRRSSSAADAALELRELLGRAVVERMGGGVTSVWMSGGWDSTAVFAAGQQALPASERSRLRPVSISYPMGDPGREDELIREIGQHWQADIHWIESDRIPLLDDLEARAARTDEPPAHLYELWNLALGRGSRAIGARIALDGCGGDNLFQVSDVILADLLANGRVLEFARRASARRSQGLKYLAWMGILPLLPETFVRAMERVAGRRFPRHYMEHPSATWVRDDFAAAHSLRDRALATLRAPSNGSLAQAENILYITHPAWGWAGSYMRGVLLQQGVEVRSPLLDLRVVEFALRRPVAERADRVETKILLRRAMAGLLPESVLAARPYRTGVTSGFSRRRMREAYPALLEQLFAKPLRLADLGIVEEAALRTAAGRWLNQGDESVRMNLFNTMRVEFWLRGLDATPGTTGGAHPLHQHVAEAPAA